MSGPSLSGVEPVLSPVSSPVQADLGAKFSQLLMELNQAHQHQVTGFQQRCQELDRSRKHYYTELKKALGAMKSLKTENQKLQQQLRSLGTRESTDACKNCLSLQGALKQKEDELKSIRQEREQYVKSQEAQMKDLQNRLSQLLSLQASHHQGQNVSVQNRSEKVKESSLKDGDTSSDIDVPMRLAEGGQTEEVVIPNSDSEMSCATKQAATRLHRQNKRVRYKENVKTSPDREEGKEMLKGRQKKHLALADTQGEFTQQMKMSRILVPDTLAVEASTESDEQNSQTITERSRGEEEKENRRGKYQKANCRAGSSSAEERIQEEDPAGDPACDPITMIPETMAMEEDLEETRMLISPPSCSSTPVNHMGKTASLANQKPARSIVTSQLASKQTKGTAVEQPQPKQVVSQPGSPAADMSPPVSPTFGRPACPTAVTTDTTCESPLLFGDSMGTRVEESGHQKKVPTSQEIQPLFKAPRTPRGVSPALQSPLVLRIKTEPVTQEDSDVSPLLLGLPAFKVKQEPRGHDPTRQTLRGEFDEAAAGVGPSGTELTFIHTYPQVEGELEEAEDTQQGLSTKRRNRTTKVQEKRSTRRSTRAAARESQAVRSSPRVKNSQQSKKTSRGGKRKSCFDEDSDISEDDVSVVRAKGKRSRSKRVLSSQSSSKQKAGAPTEGSPGLKQLTLTQAMFNQKTELHRSQVYRGGLRKNEPPLEDSDLQQVLELSRKETSPHAAEEAEAVRLAVQRSIHDITNTREPAHRARKQGGAKPRSRNRSTQSTSSENCQRALEDTFDPDCTFLPGKFKVPGVPSTSTQRDTQFQSQQYTNGPLNGSLDPDIQLTELDTTTLPVDSQGCGDDGRGRKRNSVVKSGRGKTDISRLFDETDYGGEEGEDMDTDVNLGTPEVTERKNIVFLSVNVTRRVPRKEEGPNYKYAQVVRKKDERRKLHGHDCQCCKDWYGDMSESQKRLRMKATSRHRQQHSPTSTPEGFWDIGMQDTPELRARVRTYTTTTADLPGADHTCSPRARLPTLVAGTGTHPCRPRSPLPAPATLPEYRHLVARPSR
uniref:DNA endonuclease activator Ctp1 C-terminal domain-containing protein n=1 Tax=Branchiostoma floridae TaxID=7739 RepID=C3ZMX5_BRAFL|eukprot:XP_002590104.1 hypothetical protein BRAFLDRAFT_83382 [Branchiostoma floridae]